MKRRLSRSARGSGADQDVAGPEARSCGLEVGREPIGEGVVGHDLPRSARCRGRRRRRPLGRESPHRRPRARRVDLRVGEPGVVIDGRVDVVIALGASGDGLGALSAGARAPAIGDPPELLDVDVDQLARPGTLVATGSPTPRRTGSPVRASRSRNRGRPMTADHSPHGRGGQAELGAQPVGARGAGDAPGGSAARWPQGCDAGSAAAGSVGQPGPRGPRPGSGAATCRRWRASSPAGGRHRAGGDRPGRAEPAASFRGRSGGR